jgi:hypothetical protein
VLAEQARHLLIQLANLLFGQSHLLEHHLQRPPIDGVELCARAKRVLQLFPRVPQAPIGQGGRAQRA